MRILVALMVLISPGCRDGPEPPAVHVAVASSVARAQEQIAAAFEQRTGTRVLASSASSGKLYAQVVNGARFDVLLSADETRPRRLVEDGRADPSSRFTYALGRLVLFVPSADSTADVGAELARHADRLAIANPRTAPYGVAAREVLSALGLPAAVGSAARGENVLQTMQFARSGAVDAALVSLSVVSEEPPSRYRAVPDSLHRPIRHDAVLLSGGGNPAEGRAYLEFLRGPEARAILRDHGLAVPGPEGT